MSNVVLCYCLILPLKVCRILQYLLSGVVGELELSSVEKRKESLGVLKETLCKEESLTK